MPGWLVANEGTLTVALEIELTDELRQEGLARELVNRIQNLRKESGLAITDRISVSISKRDEVEKAVAAFGGYIKAQVLADDVRVEDNGGTEVKLDDYSLNIQITKC